MTPRYINPGEYVFGVIPEGVRTLLGSCASIVLWHPERRILGFCHILLPETPKSQGTLVRRDGYYADQVMTKFLDDMRSWESQPGDYVMELYGGSRLLLANGETLQTPFSVGARNIEYIHARAGELGWHFSRVDTGGPLPRRIEVNGMTGKVTVQFVPARRKEAL
ncbi:chemotaxis protein CheD [Mangrovitalea sediminis]|uniref:chemotaxis protein CheD n=1 Tax=Mangrovitalea sediminis TaxID=1982043 RepID=UPI0018E9C584|nr:chemotaxis protein CheD [Mangrovitalea sediminis]